MSTAMVSQAYRPECTVIHCRSTWQTTHPWQTTHAKGNSPSILS